MTNKQAGLLTLVTFILGATLVLALGHFFGNGMFCPPGKPVQISAELKQQAREVQATAPPNKPNTVDIAEVEVHGVGRIIMPEEEGYWIHALNQIADNWKRWWRK